MEIMKVILMLREIWKKCCLGCLKQAKNKLKNSQPLGSISISGVILLSYNFLIM
jgi:hypothetical protein